MSVVSGIPLFVPRGWLLAAGLLWVAACGSEPGVSTSTADCQSGDVCNPAGNGDSDGTTGAGSAGRSDSADEPLAPLPAFCSDHPLRLKEVAVGDKDYVVLENYSPDGPPIALQDYQIVMRGHPIRIGSYEPQQLIVVDFFRQAIGPGETLHVYENTDGGDDPPGGTNTWMTFPFYNGVAGESQNDNSVLLVDPLGRYIDYLAIGSAKSGMPGEITFTPDAVAWPSDFDAGRQSFQRTATAGRCPAFRMDDWSVSDMSRRL